MELSDDGVYFYSGDRAEGEPVRVRGIADGVQPNDAVNKKQLDELSSALSDEAMDRTNADTALGVRIDTETTTREMADTTLGSRIDSNVAAIDSLNSKVDEVSSDLSMGIAGVAAIAAIPAPQPGNKYSIGLGVGHYNDQNALAAGWNINVTQNVRVKGAVSFFGGNHSTVNMGIGYSW